MSVADSWHSLSPSFCSRVKPYWVSWPSYLKGYYRLTHCRFLTWGHSMSWKKDFQTCVQQHNQLHYVTCFMLHPHFIGSCFWHICLKGICVFAGRFPPPRRCMFLGSSCCYCCRFLTLWNMDQLGEVYFLSTNIVLNLIAEGQWVFRIFKNSEPCGVIPSLGKDELLWGKDWTGVIDKEFCSKVYASTCSIILNYLFIHPFPPSGYELLDSRIHWSCTSVCSALIGDIVGAQ